MSAFSELWRRFEDKEYREEFVSAQVKRAIPFQIRAMLKDRDLTQTRFAEESGIEQGVVSRAANPSYGNLSVNTIIRIAAGFDVAFIGKFVPFSELGKWFLDVSEADLGRVPSFAEEVANREKLALAERAKEDLEEPPTWRGVAFIRDDDSTDKVGTVRIGPGSNTSYLSDEEAA